MKTISTFLLLLLSTYTYSQAILTYKATNGITYNVGDTLKLGQGSSANKTFVYIQVSGLMVDIKNPERNYLPATYAGSSLIIKSIKPHKGKVFFFVKGGNYALIDEAIAACEVIPCKETEAPKNDKYADLKQLKELLDSGAITQEEYNKEKEKILN